MGKSPSFQFYPHDWTGDINVILMTPAQEGALIRLLCYMWDDEDCGIPDDDLILAPLSRLNEGWFNGGSSMVRKCFIKHPYKDGFLSSEKLLKEREKQRIWREKSVEAGKKSGEKRRQKSKNKDKTKVGSTKHEPIVNQPRTLQSSSSSSSSISLSNDNKILDIVETPKVSPTTKIIVPFDLRSEKFKEEIQYFKPHYPQKMLDDFFLYWSEKTQIGEKMKWELQKTWELHKRLAKWKSNNEKNIFTNQNSQAKVDPDKRLPAGL